MLNAIYKKDEANNLDPNSSNGARLEIAEKADLSQITVSSMKRSQLWRVKDKYGANL